MDTHGDARRAAADPDAGGLGAQNGCPSRRCPLPHYNGACEPVSVCELLFSAWPKTTARCPLLRSGRARNPGPAGRRALGTGAGRRPRAWRGICANAHQFAPGSQSPDCAQRVPGGLGYTEQRTRRWARAQRTHALRRPRHGSVGCCAAGCGQRRVARNASARANGDVSMQF